MFCFFHVQASSCPEIRALARQRPLTWRSLAATRLPPAPGQRACPAPCTRPSQPPTQLPARPCQWSAQESLSQISQTEPQLLPRALRPGSSQQTPVGWGRKGRDRHALNFTSWVLPEVKSLYLTPPSPLSSSPHASRSGVFGLLSQPPCHPYLERIGRPLPSCRLGSSGTHAVPASGAPRSTKRRSREGRSLTSRSGRPAPPANQRLAT